MSNWIGRASRVFWTILAYCLRWFFVASVVGALSGTASAAFLYCLDKVTLFRELHGWLIFLLPIGGFLIGLVYWHFGRSVDGGNNLLIDEIHDPKNTVQLRMAPLVFLGSVLTHLLGGSAGREGTAIQMGGSLADQLAAPLGLKNPADRKNLLIAGLAGGFGSVFGTPLAGAIFGLEVLAIGGRLRSESLFPAIVASLVGQMVTLVWGIHHTLYSVPFVPLFGMQSFFYTALAGVFFGLVARLFVSSTSFFVGFWKRKLSWPPLIPLVGGTVFALIFAWPQLRLFQGLGVPVILDSFSRRLPLPTFFVKIFATALTLGSGFKGGEVTPLFFIGSTAGNALSSFFPLPLPVLSALGFVAVFAGAANVPLASIVLAIELFGRDIAPLAAVACIVSFMFSSHKGIYHSQRVENPKRS